MVIHDPTTFKLVTQAFFLLSLVVSAIAYYLLKLKKVEVTRKVTLKVLLFVGFPIVAFPFLVFSELTFLWKIIGTLFAVLMVLLQFYGTISFHKVGKSIEEKRIEKKDNPDTNIF